MQYDVRATLLKGVSGGSGICNIYKLNPVHCYWLATPSEAQNVLRPPHQAGYCQRPGHDDMYSASSVSRNSDTQCMGVDCTSLYSRQSALTDSRSGHDGRHPTLRKLAEMFQQHPGALPQVAAGVEL
jgi:hypothetical protein